ncbi:MAG: nicotinate-nucleotide adenylyltransferase [Betaproteobacteria bacterium]|nr:nicotinate-nucleotide adenylyltransferase [Betaproteobacteria bacterium]
MSDGALVGIFGGTFDPVHYGHLRLAEEARAALGLAEVRWIPAGQPPHRSAPQAAVEHRLAMLRLALAGNPAYSLDDSEALSAAPSYSVPTLERLRARLGAQRPLVLLLGVDAFLGLGSWHRWRELFGLAHLAVATRPGYTLEAGQMAPALAGEFHARRKHAAAALSAAPAGCILPFPITALDISATHLRATLRSGSGGSARYLLPDPVLDYIAGHKLYLADR